MPKKTLQVDTLAAESLPPQAASVLRWFLPELSLVIPAFNESLRLAKTLESLTTWLQERGRTFEIIVVDDGSADETAEIARRFLDCGVQIIRHPENQGKGAAVRTGVAQSLGSTVLICDADASTPIEELDRLEPHLQEAPVVIGSRVKDSARILRSQSGFRVLIGRAFNLVVQLTTVGGITDTQCGFKLMSGAVARRLFAQMKTDGFAFDVELLWLARRADYPILEVGVQWRDQADSKVRPWRDGPMMLAEILRFRLHHHELAGWIQAANRSFNSEAASEAISSAAEPCQRSALSPDQL